jgi:hypothetical protein
MFELDSTDKIRHTNTSATKARVGGLLIGNALLVMNCGGSTSTNTSSVYAVS